MVVVKFVSLLGHGGESTNILNGVGECHSLPKKTKFVLGPQIDEYLEMGGVSLQKNLVLGRGPKWLSLPFFGDNSIFSRRL